MKSALELAMEKADSMVDKDQVKLTPDQIAAIDEVKKEYEAKWAEQEIVLKARIKKVAEDTDPQTFAEHQRQFQDEMNQVRDKIYQERDQRLAEIRSGA